ncbi:MAG: molybdopterin-dependent oxidoreductase [Vulcanimicrobiota bacterium]
MAEIHLTTCNRDCPDACTLEVTVEDGQAVRLRGAAQDPVTRGFLCERTSRFLERQYDPERITTPLLRRDGHLEPIGWDEALDIAAEKLAHFRDAHGNDSILNYRSGGSLGLLKHLTDFFFELFGPVCIKHGDICSGAGEAAQEADFGLSDSSDIFDLHNSKLIVVWGKNIHTSNTHLMPVILEAKRRGAKLIGIDLVKTRIASQCDLFLTPRPGSDYALAMGAVRWLFEHHRLDPQAASYCDNLETFRELAFARELSEWAHACDLSAAQLKEFSRLYADNAPAAILIGWGLGRRRNGSRTVRAIDGLAAISGNMGVAGGGASFYFQRKACFDTSFVRGRAIAPRSFSEARLGPELLAADPPVRMAWISAGNPVSMLPDSASVKQALEAMEFVVVVETHPTDTTDCADLVLPTLTLLEDDDLLGAYGNHYVRESRPAVPPAGQARHELWILQQLAERLGFGQELAGTPRDWKRKILKPEVRLEDLAEGPVKSPFAPEVVFAGRKFATANGKVQLLAEAALDPPRPDHDYPLTLLAVSTPKAQSSQWSVTAPRRPEVRVHPSRGAAGPARLESAHGGFEVEVVPDEAVRPDVVYMAKGGMLRHGWCANALVEAVETDDGGGAAYYDQPVRLVT